MKGGQKPIHIMRWAPQDFVGDPVVRLALAKRDYAAIVAYVLILNWSFIEGGDLPADVDALAAMIGMPKRDVEKALPLWLKPPSPNQPKLAIDETCLFNPRVRRDIRAELEKRAVQSVRGHKGADKRWGGDGGGHNGGMASAIETPMGSPSNANSPPTPIPTPSPTPIRGGRRMPKAEWDRVVAEGNGYLDEILRARPGADRSWELRQHSLVPGTSAYLMDLDRAKSDEHLQRTVHRLRETAERLREPANGTHGGLPSRGPWEAQ